MIPIWMRKDNMVQMGRVVVVFAQVRHKLFPIIGVPTVDDINCRPIVVVLVTHRDRITTVLVTSFQ